MAAVTRPTFDAGNTAPADGADGRHAGTGRPAVPVHRAGAAQRHAAAELGAAEAERVAQHPQERRVGVHVDRGVAAVEVEFDQWANQGAA